MKYIKSKYLFATSRKINGSKDICLLFSGRTGKNIYISPMIFENIIQGRIDMLSDKIREKLIDQKILVPEKEDEFLEVNKENLCTIEQDANDKLYISIQPTASCQLACDYCGQKHFNKTISDELINAIISRINNKLAGGKFKKIEIGWFGGEPLCTLGRMRKLNTLIKNIARNNNIEYSGHITSNGYALTPLIYAELKEEFNIKRIEITIDGSKEYHDKRRITIQGRGSFDKIFANLKSIVLSDQYDMKECVISIRCNVDERNINGVIPLLENFINNDMQKKILFYTASVVSWSNNGAGSENGRKNLGLDSTTHLAFMLENGFKTSILPHRTAPFKCLGTDKNAEMYDAEGNIFDCSETSYSDYYSKQGYILGNLCTGDNLKLKRSKLQYVPDMLLKGTISSCKNCKFYPLCGGLCPLALIEGSPRCPSFIYNIEDRMFLDFIAKNRV